jgi:nitroreductase
MTQIPTPELDRLEHLIRARRSIRNFKPDPIDPDLLRRLCDLARWAPSGYNIQPTHMIIVTDAATRERLYVPCMSQRQIREAPALVVFAGDLDVHRSNAEAFLAMDKAAGAMTPDYEALLRKVIPLAFGRGPLGLNWLWKATLLPVVRLFRPIPNLPALEPSYWAAKQVSLAAMTFMLAAAAAGLATLPMEGFDDGRVQRTLAMPRHIRPIILVAVGYSEDHPTKTRLELERILHWQRW